MMDAEEGTDQDHRDHAYPAEQPEDARSIRSEKSDGPPAPKGKKRAEMTAEEKKVFFFLNRNNCN